MNLTDPTTMGLGGLFLTVFIITFSGAVMPGPVLVATINHATRQGVRAGPLIILGHAILEMALLAALVAGLGPFLTKSWVGGIIGGAGAIILIYMGLDMLRSLPGLKLELNEAGAGQARAAGPVRDGFLLSLANPYWSIWWATVGLSLTTMAMDVGLGLWGLAVFYVGHILADLTWYTIISLVVAKGRRFITDKVHRGVVAVCAVFLLGFAAYFGYFAWEQLAA